MSTEQTKMRDEGLIKEQQTLIDEYFNLTEKLSKRCKTLFIISWILVMAVAGLVVLAYE